MNPLWRKIRCFRAQVLTSPPSLDQVTNGANLFWAPQFGLITSSDDPNASRNQWLLGALFLSILCDQAS